MWPGPERGLSLAVLAVAWRVVPLVALLAVAWVGRSTISFGQTQRSRKSAFLASQRMRSPSQDLKPTPTSSHQKPLGQAQ